MFEISHKELQRSKRDQTSLSIIIVDVDFFKKYNDYYGHVSGDLCLKKVAITLQSVLCRSGDIVGRYGGEEFMFVLPNTDREGALSVAEKALFAIQNLQIPHELSACNKLVSISMGISSICPNQSETIEHLIKLADDNLYIAKHAGKNRFHYSKAC
ncbi:MAG: diguanylate cyclase [Gammaproteobacteria bacterium]